MTSQPRVPYGIARTATLRSLGVDRRHHRQLVDAGELRQVRHGWWATTAADPAAVRAVALGGYLTCLSALERHGLWIPETADLHLRFAESQRVRPARLPRGTLVCTPRCQQRSPRHPVDPLPLALSAASRCVSEEEFVAILDSALHRLRLTRADLLDLLQDAPQRARQLVELCDRAEAGTESLIRLRMRARGIRVRTQQVILGVGRVDLLVGRSLVIEADSQAHHTGQDNYHRDRERDLALYELGYTWVRLTYHQVIHAWATTWPRLQSLIRRREHLKVPLVEPLERGW